MIERRTWIWARILLVTRIRSTTVWLRTILLSIIIGLMRVSCSWIWQALIRTVTLPMDLCPHLPPTHSTIKRIESSKELGKPPPNKMKARIMWHSLKTMLSCNLNLSIMKIKKGLLNQARALRKEGQRALWELERVRLADSEIKLLVRKSSFKTHLTIAINSRIP